MSPTVYLISGSNRGLGLGLVKQLIKRDNVVVFAGVRDLARATGLQALTRENPEKLHMIKLVSADEIGNRAAIKEIELRAGRLDVVIANAAIGKHTGPALDLPVQEMRNHFEVNTVGILALFQASYPLLKASTAIPKFVIISSRVGSIPIGAAISGGFAYKASKAAVNYLACQLHYENDGLVIFPICPGAVDTDMFAPYKHSHPPEDIDMMNDIRAPEEAASGVLSIIDGATRHEDSPVFRTVDGGMIPW